jgi:hypothetical protein
MQRYNLKHNDIFPNFEWLAKETEKIMKKREAEYSTLKTLMEKDGARATMSEPFSQLAKNKFCETIQRRSARSGSSA